jgi:hypothetical protein
MPIQYLYSVPIARFLGSCLYNGYSYHGSKPKNDPSPPRYLSDGFLNDELSPKGRIMMVSIGTTKDPCKMF